MDCTDDCKHVQNPFMMADVLMSDLLILTNKIE